MINLRTKITENLIGPAVVNRSAAFYEGVIVKADEKSNTCSVKYKDNQGVTVTQPNVVVQLSNIGMIDWFPSVNDRVHVMDKEGFIYISGPSYAQDYITVRSQIKLEEDVFTDSSNYFIGGSIY